MRVLVFNCGSSSLKFCLCEVAARVSESAQEAVHMLLHGAVEGLGNTATLSVTADGATLSQPATERLDHAGAVRWVLAYLQSPGAGMPALLATIDAVGHRVVHGGPHLQQAVRLDAHVLAAIERASELAPLHNLPSLAGIRAAMDCLGTQVPMVAVFDTAFHHTLPAYASTYALPQELATRHHIRRYGFHGLAHASMAAAYAQATGRPLHTVRLITFQLGHGCSVAAIRAGESVDTSMGLTPLEGLVMSTRSGDLDPAVVNFLARREGITAEQVEQWLNERSGLLGLSGLSPNMRQLLTAAEHEQHAGATLAIDVFCYRARKYLGAYLAVLGGANAVVFGGGIGERAPTIRSRICAGMEWCGLALDPERNARAIDVPSGQAVQISRDDARLAAYVVAVDEETQMARETVRCLHNSGAGAEAVHGRQQAETKGLSKIRLSQIP